MKLSGSYNFKLEAGITTEFLHFYSNFWHTNSDNQSVYYSPSSIEFLLKIYSGNAMVFYATSAGDNLLVTIWLKKKKRTVSFLADQYSDHNQIQFSPELTFDQRRLILEDFFKSIYKFNLYLMNIPPWTEDLRLLVAANSRKNLYFDAWSCPTSEYSDDFFDKSLFYKKKFRKSTINNLRNRLEKSHGGVLEVYEDNRYVLSEWVSDFSNCHELRWNETNTPSIFRFSNERVQLLDRLEGMVKDKTLLLFSIKTHEGRIAMAICLKEGKRLIYHLIAYNPSFSEFSPNAVLLQMIGEWMKNSHFEILDFGTGDEGYKIRFSTHVHKLVRYYSFHNGHNSAFLLAHLEHRIRSSESLMSLWDNFRELNRDCLRILEHYKLSFTRFISELKPHPITFLRMKLFENVLPEEMIFYSYANDREIEVNDKDGLTFQRATTNEILLFYEKIIQVNPEKRIQYIEIMQSRSRAPYVLKKGDEIVQLSWVKDPEESEFPDHESLRNYKVIVDCVTPAKQRGKGYYPYILNLLVREINFNGKSVLIYTHKWNNSSQKGIEKSGFKKIYIRKSIKRGYVWIKS